MTREEINKTGIFAGMTTKEISDFMDKEFYDLLIEMSSAKFANRVSHLRWLTHSALLYAQSDGLLKKALRED